MDGYLGETVIDINKDESPYGGFTAEDWAMTYIEYYGQIDGSHHKQWVLDQVSRILKGTPVIVKLAKWDNGHEEYRFSTGEVSRAYLDWIDDMRGDIVDGEYTYSYDEGIAP